MDGSNNEQYRSNSSNEDIPNENQAIAILCYAFNLIRYINKFFEIDSLIICLCLGGIFVFRNFDFIIQNLCRYFPSLQRLFKGNRSETTIINVDEENSGYNSTTNQAHSSSYTSNAISTSDEEYQAILKELRRKNEALDQRQHHDSVIKRKDVTGISTSLEYAPKRPRNAHLSPTKEHEYGSSQYSPSIGTIHYNNPPTTTFGSTSIPTEKKHLPSKNYGHPNNPISSQIHQQIKSNATIEKVSPMFKIEDNEKHFGFVGRREIGKSSLISSIFGLSIKELDNYGHGTLINGVHIYEIKYPYSFIEFTTEEQAMYEEYFREMEIFRLKHLFIAIDDDFRKEDLLVISIALKMNMKKKIVIIKTRFDRRCVEIDADEKTYSVDDYEKNNRIEKDKIYIRSKLDESNLPILPVYIVSSPVLNAFMKRPNGKPGNLKYIADEESLTKFFKKSHVNLIVEQNYQPGFSQNDEQKTLPMVKMVKPSSSTSVSSNKSLIVFGRHDSGKSKFIDALSGITHRHNKSITKIKNKEINLNNTLIKEVAYTEGVDNAQALYDSNQVKKYTTMFVIVPDAVGKIDVELIKIALNHGKRTALIITKHDDHVRNSMDDPTDLQSRKNVSVEVYRKSLDEAVKNLSYGAVNFSNADLNIFILSSTVLRIKTTESNKTSPDEADEEKLLSELVKLGIDIKKNSPLDSIV